MGVPTLGTPRGSIGALSQLVTKVDQACLPQAHSETGPMLGAEVGGKRQVAALSEPIISLIVKGDRRPDHSNVVWSSQRRWPQLRLVREAPGGCAHCAGQKDKWSNSG